MEVTYQKNGTPAKVLFDAVRDTAMTIPSLRRRLERLRDVSTNAGGVMGGGVYEHSGNHSRIETITADIIDMERELEQKIEKFYRLQVVASEIIDKLPPPHRTICTYRVLAADAWPKVFQALGHRYSSRHILRLYAQALSMVDKQISQNPKLENQIFQMS